VVRALSQDIEDIRGVTKGVARGENSLLPFVLSFRIVAVGIISCGKLRPLTAYISAKCLDILVHSLASSLRKAAYCAWHLAIKPLLDGYIAHL